MNLQCLDGTHSFPLEEGPKGDEFSAKEPAEMAPRTLLQIKQTEEEMGTTKIVQLEFVMRTERGEIRESSRPPHHEWQECLLQVQALSAKLNDLVGGPQDAAEHWDTLEQTETLLVPPSILDRLYESESVLEIRSDADIFCWDILPAFKRQHLLLRVEEKPVRVLSPVDDDGVQRVFVGFNADEMSDWSRPEAERLQQHLSERFEVHLREGKALSKKQVLRTLSEGSFSLVHLVVYLVPQGVVLHDGVLPWRELERLQGTKRPGLVVVHAVACSDAPLGDWSHILARSLGRAGVPAVLVSAWNPNPKWSCEFFGSLFTAKDEWNLGQQLQVAKNTAPEGHDLHRTDGAYRAYGDWEQTLASLRAVNIETAQNAPTAKGSWQADFQLTFLEGPQKGASIPLYAAALDGGRKITIGRSGPKDVDLIIEDDGLENVAIELSKSDGKLVLTNKTGSPNRIKVNELAVSAAVTLHGCDEIRLGESTCLRLEKVGEKGDSSSKSLPPDHRYALLVKKGNETDVGQKFPLDSRVSMVGRLPDCTVMLHDAEVSRNHLILVPKEGGFFVSGVGGALVVLNGFPLKEEHRLRHGDTLQLSSETVVSFVDTDREG